MVGSKKAVSTIRSASSSPVIKVKTDCGSILLGSFILLVISMELSSAARVCDLQPITRNVGYYKKGSMCFSWSQSGREKDYSMQYEVMDFVKQNITDDFNKFFKMYPTALIGSYGEAVSMSTFGKFEFSSRGISTRQFDHGSFKNEAFLYVYRNKNMSYRVKADIGFGFRRSGSKLYLRPYYSTLLYSIGGHRRCLNYVLDVKKITFYPEQSKCTKDL